MSRKDYRLLAAAINSAVKAFPNAEPPLRMVANELCTVLKQDNPEFRVSTFMEACGLDHGN